MLTDNVRNTSPIIAATNRISDKYQLPDNGVDGEQVVLIACNPDNLAKEVANEITRLVEEKVPPREIAVLCAWSSEQVDAFIPKLQPLLHTRIARDPGDNVLMETVRRFQGLDASVVILVGLDAVAHNAGAMLVAMTRARSRLTVLATPELCARIGEFKAPSPGVEFRKL